MMQEGISLKASQDVNLKKKYPDGHKTYEVSDLRSDVGGDRIWDDKMYWLPILETERDKNPGLVQNPLYTD
jgi:hypothetical protein